MTDTYYFYKIYCSSKSGKSFCLHCGQNITFKVFFHCYRDAQEQEAASAPAMPPPSSPSEPPQPTSRSVEESVVEHSNCLRTRVEPGTLEYKEIEKLLGDTPLVINHIEKIVSDALWEKYKR